MSDRVTFADFSGGLWIADEAAPTTEQAGFAVPQNALLQADNVDFLPSGAIRGRRGSARYNAAVLAGAGNVLALRRFYPRPTRDFLRGAARGGQSDAAGTIAWTNPAGIEGLFDLSHASVQLFGGVQSHFVVAYAPFAATPIPADATVLGIIARVTYASAVGTLTEASVRLFVNNAPVGVDKSTGAVLPSGGLTVAQYGADSDLWGVGLSAADVNSDGFGVGISLSSPTILDLGIVYWIDIECWFSSALPVALLAAHRNGAALQYSAATAGVFSAVPGGTLADPLRRPRIVAWPQKGKLFLFDGVNPLSQYDGQAVSTVPTYTNDDGVALGLSPRKGPYATLYRSRLFATEPGELSHSVYACDINREGLWRPQAQLSVNDDRGGEITGLETFGDAVVILKSTGVWAFVGDAEFGGQLAEIGKVGCIAPDSVAVTPFGVVFVGREGVWLTDGSSVQLVSAAIRPLFVDRGTERTWTDAVGVYFPRRAQYWLKLDPSDPAAPGYVLHRVVLPTTQGDQIALAWSRIPALRMNCGAVADGAGDDGDLFLGDRAGVVWLRDTGSTDEAVAYTTEIATQQRQLDRARIEARVQRVRPLYRGAQPLSAGLRYDQATVDQIGLTLGGAAASPVFQEPRVYVLDKVRFGRFLSFRAASTEGPAFELHRVDLDTRRRGARAWR